ncbi:MAG: 3-deoxy-D-manno-octulosonic acid transferase [Candidatus Riflebacteria bacterium]|nr:3-deoxy-D-manno-octulosonic acid transferase [Candidatus Riflebacteria bacterium]
MSGARLEGRTEGEATPLPASAPRPIVPLPIAPFLVYNALLLASLPLLLLALAFAALTGRRVGRTWRAQLGWELPQAPVQGGALWLQAASVGEAQAVRRLVEGLRARLPRYPVLLTGSTPEGMRVAREKVAAHHHAAFPFDFPWVLDRWFETYSPRACLVVETEIWPNLIWACARRGLPLVLVNGRLSPGRMRRYKILRPFYRQFLAGFSLLLMQSEDDAQRIAELGANPDAIHIVGDLKYDNLPEPADSDGPGDFPVIVAGSTHPGESERVIDSYSGLRHSFDGLALVLAPRHPETAGAAIEHAARLGLEADRRSAGHDLTRRRILVLDSVGELTTFYRRATVAFVGGSLVSIGGHSLLEPASLARPVLYGPHAFHFAEAARWLEEAGGGRQVDDGLTLTGVLSILLSDRAEAERMGKAARAVVTARGGATARTLEHLERLLGSGCARGGGEPA